MLVDVELFVQARRIYDSLAVEHQTAPCLQWCNEHKTALKRAKSQLEYAVREQEYIQLVVQERRVDAIHYVRKHLAPQADTHFPELQRVMGLISYPPTTHMQPYKARYLHRMTSLHIQRKCTLRDGGCGWRNSSSRAATSSMAYRESRSLRPTWRAG